MKTLREIEACDKDMLSAEDIAPIFPVTPHSLRIQAHEKPEALGFPVVTIGVKTFFPREGFLAFCRASRIGEVTS